MTKIGDTQESEQVARLAAGWRRFLEMVERQRRERDGESPLQVLEGGQGRAA